MPHLTFSHTAFSPPCAKLNFVGFPSPLLLLMSVSVLIWSFGINILNKSITLSSHGTAQMKFSKMKEE